PNVDAPAIVLAPVNPDHAPAQPVEEDAKEEEEDPKEDSEEDSEEEPKDDDDDMEMDDEAETAWKRLGKMEKFMSERIDTEGRIKKKDAAIATSGIDDDDDTAPMDSQPHEPRG
nr:hypothetical protein [Tanacetum cinerariifolium]